MNDYMLFYLNIDPCYCFMMCVDINYGGDLDDCKLLKKICNYI